MIRLILRRPLCNVYVVFAACCLLSSQAMAGTSYGIFDARTLAMGGASVASANNSNGQFYNSALLAFNTEFEEHTEDSRFLFPIVSALVSQSVLDLERFARTGPDESLTRAIVAFNQQPDATNARAVANAAAGLEASLARLANDNLFGDTYAGLGVSEPGKLQGAGFFIGMRVVGEGTSVVGSDDLATTAAYRDGLLFISSGGALGTAHPELFDSNGALVDPASGFASVVDAAGVTIMEAGVAMARQLRPFGLPVAAGITIKVFRADAFVDTRRIVDVQNDLERNSDSEAGINFDVGLAKQLGEHWRVGLAVKDIVPRDIDTYRGNIVHLRPRPRIGAAFNAGRLQLALDTDVLANEPLGGEFATQETSFGAEWRLDWPVAIRAGYRHDLRGFQGGTLSLGLGAVWHWFAADLAYSQGADTKAASLQFGIAF